MPRAQRFDDGESGILVFVYHLQADDGARLLEANRVTGGTAHQSEDAVDVPSLQIKERRDRVVIDTADANARHRTRPADRVPIDHVDARPESGPENVHAKRILLRIAIGENDVFLGGDASGDRFRERLDGVMWKSGGGRLHHHDHVKPGHELEPPEPAR